MDNTRDAFIIEMANPKRLDILQILSDNPLTFTDLTKKMDISSSEISRHLNRLTEQNFIEKQHPSRNFQLTALGKLIVSLISPLDFVLYHAKYFQAHMVTDLPSNLIKKIESLKHSEFLEGIGLVMIKMEEFAKSAKNSFEVMVETPFPWGTSNLHVKYIIPPSILQLRDKVENVNASTDARILDTIPFSIAIADNAGGMLFFPDLNGKPDYNAGFVISPNDNMGCQFLREIWEYFWQLGTDPRTI